MTGQKREETWDATQPKLTLRWRPSDNVTLYGDLSRGFRSGGFNQSGVALAGVAGVFNTFDEQIADTIEVGMQDAVRGRPRDLERSRIYDTDLSARTTSSSSWPRARRTSAASMRSTTTASSSSSTRCLTDNLTSNVGLASMDSEIDGDAQIPHVVGQEVPLAPDYTVEPRRELDEAAGERPLEFVVARRLHSIGDT